jgi:hypothetical protein
MRPLKNSILKQVMSPCPEPWTATFQCRLDSEYFRVRIFQVFLLPRICVVYRRKSLSIFTLNKIQNNNSLVCHPETSSGSGLKVHHHDILFLIFWNPLKRIADYRRINLNFFHQILSILS